MCQKGEMRENPETDAFFCIGTACVVRVAHNSVRPLASPRLLCVFLCKTSTTRESQEMVQPYVSQAAWNNGIAGGSRSCELDEGSSVIL